MSDNLPAKQPSPSERSTFIQDTRIADPIADRRLFFLSFFVAVGAGFYFRSWQKGLLVGIAAYVALSIIYTILARIFDWRRLRMMAFLGELLSYLGIFVW